LTRTTRNLAIVALIVWWFSRKKEVVTSSISYDVTGDPEQDAGTH
jgi:hypothetical protein